ncbi:ABC transporter ATP-binding protein [Kordiimonas pumila]|uniref:Dipeptide ABC transporter ATP-binding protein n=1 Tax=Kordiimonas pumila TaxID=2161677 RepID=A0ABV7D4A0_9PROT|nr:ABC transporter ATP-binding protein [Kordiimonas pumila]
MTNSVLANDTVLAVENLHIDITVAGEKPKPIVNDVSFGIQAGGITALVGESGSGKTMIGRALLRLLPPVARVSAGTMLFKGTNLQLANDAGMRSLRGNHIGMVFQEPMSSLNPALRIGFQMSEALMLHKNMTREEARIHSIEMLKRVQITNPEESFNAYPYQFSGGMRQRIMLASVLAMRPALLIADEPTTALDALIRKEIMELMLEITKDIGTGVLLISHDLGMVAQYAEDVVVLRKGVQIESGKCSDILLSPQHDYTRDLMGALPARRTDMLEKTYTKPLLDIKNLCVDFKRSGSSFWKKSNMVRAVDRASFAVNQGEILAVVGESGSGKTTIGRTIMQLCAKSSGQIFFEGQDLDSMAKGKLASVRGNMQMVFQDPFSSLDPRMTLEATVAEGLRHNKSLTAKEKRAQAQNMLTEVGLPGDFAGRYPHELSGGQRQRVCIARAIVAQPMFIVADEPVSALDVTIQHQVLKLLARLQEKYGFSYLFISHDLGVVEQVADRVVVMYRGKILEVGSRDDIFDRPCHPYTIRLLEATPRLVKQDDTSYRLVDTVATRTNAPEGYVFFNHGSIPGAAITSAESVMVEIAPGHIVCCAAT